MTRASRLSALFLVLLVLIGGFSVVIREPAWEISYHPFSGYHIAKEESGSFLYIDDGRGVIVILSVEAEGVKVVGRAVHYIDSFQQEPIAVSQGWLYFSTRDEGEFMAFDVRDPASPRAYGPAHLMMETFDIDVLGDMVLVSGLRYVGGRQVGTVVALNMTDPPSSISANGSADITFRLDFSGARAWSIAVDDPLLYVTEGDQPGRLHIFDVRAGVPTELLNLSREPTSLRQVFVSGSLVAVSASLGNEIRLQLFNYSGTQLEPLAQLTFGGIGFVSFEDNKMYVTGEPIPNPNHDRDLSIYDVTNPAAPRRTEYFVLQGWGGAHVVNRGTVYALGEDNLAQVRLVEKPILVTQHLLAPYALLVAVAAILFLTLWRLERRASKAGGAGLALERQ